MEAAAALTGPIPTVFVNRRCPIPGKPAFVGIDNRAAGREVARALAQAVPKGRLALVHGPLSSSATADRVAGFKRELAKLGRELGPEDMATAPGVDHLEIGYEGASALLSGRAPKGIFCASDLIAYGVQRRLREADLSVPRDVRLIGFDDNPLNDWVAPWLASVRVPYRGFGEAIVGVLGELWRGESPRAELLAYEFVGRGA